MKILNITDMYVVLNLLLSYSAPHISTSTKGHAMLRPGLGR